MPGLIGGVFLSTNFVAYMYSMMETTVANVVFIISTQTVFLPIVAYIFLKEKNFTTGICRNCISNDRRNFNDW